jgi:rhodanese-related sulfurtransferase
MKNKIFVAAVTFVAAVMIFTACSAGGADTEATETPEKVEIINNTAEEFDQIMNDSEDYLLLDVRTSQEYNDGHIEGSLLIPVTELESRLDEIADYKDSTVLVYCRSGNRSLTASQILIDNGFTDVHNLLGGIAAWYSYK